MYNSIMSELRELYFKILECKPEHRNDLKIMWSLCMKLEKDIDLENIQCRKIGHDTARKQKLTEQLKTAQNNLEQYLVFASLLNN